MYLTDANRRIAPRSAYSDARNCDLIFRIMNCDGMPEDQREAIRAAAERLRDQWVAIYTRYAERETVVGSGRKWGQVESRKRDFRLST